ncbi:MAG: hypothetical protein ABIO67_02535, partial [Mycobacteriales bacterium]
MRAPLLLLTVLLAGCSAGSATPPAPSTVPPVSPTVTATAPFAVAVTTDPHLPDHTVFLPRGVP